MAHPLQGWGAPQGVAAPVPAFFGAPYGTMQGARSMPMQPVWQQAQRRHSHYPLMATHAPGAVSGHVPSVSMPPHGPGQGVPKSTVDTAVQSLDCLAEAAALQLRSLKSSAGGVEAAAALHHAPAQAHQLPTWAQTSRARAGQTPSPPSRPGFVPPPSPITMPMSQSQPTPALEHKKSPSTVSAPGPSINGVQLQPAAERHAGVMAFYQRASSAPHHTGKVGDFSPVQRKELLQKFYKRRRGRVWKKKVRYACRKTLANGRLRIKGRFVKEGSPEEVQYRKQQAEAAAERAGRISALNAPVVL